MSQKTVDEALKSDKPDVRRLVGTEGNMGEQLGLTKDWAVRIVKQVGNYGEMFERNVGTRLAARHRARPEQPVDQGRHPIRAADPVSVRMHGRASARVRAEVKHGVGRLGERPTAMTGRGRGATAMATERGAGARRVLQRPQASRHFLSDRSARGRAVARLRVRDQRARQPARRQDRHRLRLPRQHRRLRHQPDADPVHRVRHLRPRVRGRPAQHAAGRRHRHRARDRSSAS